MAHPVDRHEAGSGHELGDRVVSHVGQPTGGTVLVEVGVGEVRRQPDVAFVEPDDVEPGCHEPRAPLLVVVDALRSETVDHQQRGISRRPTVSSWMLHEPFIAMGTAET